MKQLRNKTSANLVALIGLMIFTITTANTHGVELDKNLPIYQKVSGISGNLSSIGSDTLANLMTFWAGNFNKLYPNVNIEVQAAGSSTAPPALTQGTASLGPMSRKMKAKEMSAFEKKFGYKPTPVAVAIDALAVYVNPNNPITKLSIPQIDAIFSSTNKCGLKQHAKTWEDVGLSGKLAKMKIQLYGRNSVSGTYGYFKKKALCKGDFKADVNEQPGSASVIQSIATSINAIGYSGVGYKTSDVKFVEVSKRSGGKSYEPSTENSLNGKYPLARFLYVYINKKPGQPVNKLTQEFLKTILSKEGQKVVIKSGFIPLSAKVVNRQLKLIEK